MPLLIHPKKILKISRDCLNPIMNCNASATSSYISLNVILFVKMLIGELIFHTFKLIDVSYISVWKRLWIWCACQAVGEAFTCNGRITWWTACGGITGLKFFMNNFVRNSHFSPCSLDFYFDDACCMGRCLWQISISVMKKLSIPR